MYISFAHILPVRSVQPSECASYDVTIRRATMISTSDFAEKTYTQALTAFLRDLL